MTLSRSQKKYLKKNLKQLSLSEIVRKLNLPEKELIDYLKKAGKTPKLSPVNDFSVKNQFKNHYKPIIFLFFLVFAVYSNSLFGDFLSDDIAGIKSNPDISHFSYAFSSYLPFFSPPSFLNFLIYTFFGSTPFFYHLLNIFLHLGSVLTIFVLGNFLFAFPAGLFIAGIFSVHPLLTEAVAWISAMPYTLSSFFLLLSLLLYLTGKNRKIYLFSFFSFFLGLASNEKTVVFPLILFLYEFSFADLKNHWKRLIPFFALSGFWAFLYFGKIGQRVSALQMSFYQEPGINNPLLQIPVAVSSYLQLLFWPVTLSFYHTELSFTQSEFIIRLIIFIIYLIFIIYFFKKNRPIFFWLCFFLILLLPTLTPLRITWIVAERYAYLASLGIIIIISLLIQKTGETFKNQKAGYFLFGCLLVLLSWRTILRNFDFQNQDVLWLATAKTSPSSAQNHNNLGDYYARRGDLEKSAAEFQKAIELLPNYGDAYHNLGNIYAQMGKFDSAIENFQKAISINPGLWQSYQNIAGIYFDQGNIKEAAENLEKAIKVNPQNYNLYINLGVVYLKTGNKEIAKQIFQRALQIDPDNLKLKNTVEEILRKSN